MAIEEHRCKKPTYESLQYHFGRAKIASRKVSSAQDHQILRLKLYLYTEGQEFQRGSNSHCFQGIESLVKWCKFHYSQCLGPNLPYPMYSNPNFNRRIILRLFEPSKVCQVYHKVPIFQNHSQASHCRREKCKSISHFCRHHLLHIATDVNQFS